MVPMSYNVGKESGDTGMLSPLRGFSWGPLWTRKQGVESRRFSGRDQSETCSPLPSPAFSPCAPRTGDGCSPCFRCWRRSSRRTRRARRSRCAATTPARSQHPPSAPPAEAWFSKPPGSARSLSRSFGACLPNLVPPPPSLPTRRPVLCRSNFAGSRRPSPSSRPLRNPRARPVPGSRSPSTVHLVASRTTTGTSQRSSRSDTRRAVPAAGHAPVGVTLHPSIVSLPPRPKAVARARVPHASVGRRGSVSVFRFIHIIGIFGDPS
jgi:hypothetical protein